MSNFNYGYPTPGPQNPTAQKVLNDVFFLNEIEFATVREETAFDYIVIGSGHCGYAFVERILANALKAGTRPKILVLERGSFFLPMHFQNISPVYQNTLGGLSETFPWTLSYSTITQRTPENPVFSWNHGMVPFFGGRSIMWSAWCPTPNEDELSNWPASIRTELRGYFESAKTTLNVLPVDAINSPNRPDEAQPTNPATSPYAELQKITETLKTKMSSIPGAYVVQAAPLACKSNQYPNIDFTKWSSPAPFLNIIQADEDLRAQGKSQALSVVCDCTVEKILQQSDGATATATALQTSRGVISVGNAKVILALGTLPNTTLTLNSFPKEKFPQLQGAGTRFSSHFVTAIVARIPREFLPVDPTKFQELEIGAAYVAGKDASVNLTYHIQTSMLAIDNYAKTAAIALRYMPDVVATATREQLVGSENYAVFVLATLGEIDHSNPNNKFEKNDSPDPTTNCTLNVHPSASDLKLWDYMDDASFKTLQIIAEKNPASIEYWHDNPNPSPLSPATGTWKTDIPPKAQIRVSGLVHESSSLWMGDDLPSPVGTDFRLRSVNNVFVTGGALWPDGKSYNPTLTMVALAQILADRFQVDSSKSVKKSFSTCEWSSKTL